MGDSRPHSQAFVLTTNPGLEEVVAAEIGEHMAAQGLDPCAAVLQDSGVGGRVQVDFLPGAGDPSAWLFALRSVHHVLQHRASFEIPAEGGLARVRERVAALDWPELDSATPFRVSSERHGSHDFTSPELQGAAGAAVQRSTGAPVDLTRYRVHIQVDVIGSRCMVGVRWTERALGLRFERPFNQRVALKPPVAYAILRLAAVEAPVRILDPFCGTGTILLEAGHAYPQAGLVGSDTRQVCVDGTRANLEAAGMAERAELARLDARRLAADGERGPGIEAGSIDLLATNPPYGRQLGRRIRFEDFYRDFLHAAARVVRPGGRLALMVGKPGAFYPALRRSPGWTQQRALPVSMSGIRVLLVVLTRDIA